MAYEIYTYGGGAYLVQLFTSLKLFMGSDNFTTLIRLAGIVGLLWITLETLGKQPKGPDFMYFIRFALVYFILLVPKVNVAIVDRIDPPSSGPVVVTSVPLGIGILAHLTSTVGDGLARMYETYISIPGDMKYAQNGMLFGSSLIKSGMGLQAPNADFAHDMNAWLEACGFWQITRGIVSEDELMKAPDIWGLLSANASTLRYVNLSQQNGLGSTLWTCRDAMTYLNTQWNLQIDGAATQWGMALWPRKTPADAKAAILATASGAYGYMISTSQGSSELIKQQIMINATRQALLNYASSSDAPAAAINIAQAQAEAAQRTTYMTMGRMAAKMLPIFKSVLEAIVYGVFPIVAVALLLPMVGKALLTYVQVLIWLQLWAPLYAIINSIMTWYGQFQNGAAGMLGGASGNAVALETAGPLMAANLDLVATAGYMAISIPMMAWMLVKAGAVAGAAVVTSLNQPAVSAASQASSQAASGNVNMGNLSTDNAAMNSWSANKMDTNLSMKSGGMAVQTAAGGLGQSFGHGASGVIPDVSGSIPNLGAGITAQNSVSMAQTQMSKEANTASESSGRSSALSVAAALTDYSAYEKAAGETGKKGTGASNATEGSTGDSASTVSKWLDKFGDDNKWSSAQSATLLAAATVTTPGGSKAILKASGQFQGKSDAQLQSALDRAEQYMKETNGGEKFDLMRKGSTTESYEHADTGTRSALAGVRANLDISDGWQQKSDVQKSESRAFETAAAETRGAGTQTSARMDRDFWQDYQRDNGGGVAMAKWEGLTDHERAAAIQAWGNKYAADHADEILSRNGVGKPDSKALDDFYNKAGEKLAFKSAEQIQATHNKNVDGVIKDFDGKTPGVMPTDTVTSKAEAVQDNVKDSITTITGDVKTQGEAMKERVDRKTDVNVVGTGLAADAMGGVVTGILPNVNTPFGNSEQVMRTIQEGLGVGAPSRSDAVVLPDHPATNVAPPSWGSADGKGGTGRW